MTSISSNYAAVSPRERLQTQLLSDISAGSIQSGDKDALSAALDSIDKSLTSDRTSQSGPPAPGEMKTKIDSLIQGQVDSGALTEDQATELKQLFSETFGAQGHHRAHGAGHPPPPPPDDSQTDSASSSSSSTGLGADASDILQQFLELLKNSNSATVSYSADGSKSDSKTLSLLINFTT